MKYTFIFLMLFPLFLIGQNAKVFAVHDGDSYKILMDSSQKKTWVRLWGIDCPEVTSNIIYVDQPYGRFVADTVRSLLKSQRIFVDSVGIDMYKRPIVKIQFKTVNLTEFLIENGWGWVFKSDDMKTKEYENLLKLQSIAEKNKLGLWADDERISPARWRKIYKK